MRRLAIRVMVIGVFFLNSGAGVWAAEKSDRLTPMDVFNIQTASDAQISPNGKQIVYVRQFADVMTDRRASNLWIINFDGSENRALTTGTYSDIIAALVAGWDAHRLCFGPRRRQIADLCALDGFGADGETDGPGKLAERFGMVAGWKANFVFRRGGRAAGADRGVANAAGRREVG